ncbi:MAG: type II secretion system F family protein [Ilumatobacteraceae bacterium]
MSVAVASGALAAVAVGMLGVAVQPALQRRLARDGATGPLRTTDTRAGDIRAVDTRAVDLHAVDLHRAGTPGGTSAARCMSIIAGRRRRQAANRAAADLPDALELIVLAVRAGHLPAAAIRASLAHLPATVQPAFAEVVAQVDGGRRFADAIAVLAERLGDDALVLVDSFAAADRYGLPLAPVLDRLAAEARQQRARRTATLARQLPIRLAAPLVTCTLPSFILLAVVPLLLAALSSLRW